MKDGQTLQDLAKDLQRQKQLKRDFKAPANRIMMDADTGNVNLLDRSGMAVTDKVFQPNQLFTDQLNQWAGIPKKYAEKMRAEGAGHLLAMNQNHWLRESGDTRLVRTMDHSARAFLSHRYRMIDNVDVVASVLPILKERGVLFASQQVTDQRLYLKAVNQRKTLEVRKGDKVQLGVVISNSEVGLGAVHVDPLVFTLACLNGAVVADAGLRKFHIGRQAQELDESVEVFQDDTRQADDKAFFLKLRDTVNAAFDEAGMQDLLTAVQDGAKRRLGTGRKLEDVVEVTAKRYAMTETEADGVLRALIDGGDLTQWGLSSAITRYSQDVPGYDRATELEKAGGAVMVMTADEWKEVAQ